MRLPIPFPSWKGGKNLYVWCARCHHGLQIECMSWHLSPNEDIIIWVDGIIHLILHSTLSPHLLQP